MPAQHSLLLQAAAGNYLHAAVEAVLNIHRAEVPGDVLVFLSTGGEVQECIDLMHEALRGAAIRSLATRLQPLPLHSGAPACVGGPAPTVDAVPPVWRHCRA